MSADGTGPGQLESDIERQRAELAATVSRLQAKLDVKSRAQLRAAELKDRATTATGKPRPDLTVAAVAVAVLVAGLLVRRLRH